MILCKQQKLNIQLIFHDQIENQSVHHKYKGSNSFLYANTTKIYQFKAKDSEIKWYSLCLGNISGDFFAKNFKKTG